MRKLLIHTAAFLLALPAMAQVEPKIHKLCSEAKDYAGCININNKKDPGLSKEEWMKSLIEEAYGGTTTSSSAELGSEYCRWNPWDNECKINPNHQGVTKPSKASSSSDTSCPEGQQFYENKGFLGIGKEKLGCMTPSEASAFHQQRSQAWRNVNTQQQINQMQYQQQQQQFQQQQQQYRNGQQMYWMQQQMNKPRYGF